jgi:hypothetical protein
VASEIARLLHLPDGPGPPLSLSVAVVVDSAAPLELLPELPELLAPLLPALPEELPPPLQPASAHRPNTIQ